MSIKKSLRVEGASPSRAMLSGLLDLLSVALLSVGLTFAILYGLFSPLGGYQKKKAQARSIEDSYSLHIDSNTYEAYEKADQDFYLVHFPEEVSSYYESHYGDSFSPTHVYNIMVLHLPIRPTAESHTTALYSYAQKEDGSFDPDVLGVKREGSGKRYEKDMHDLFKTAFDDLKGLLQKFDEEYASLLYETYADECYSRGIAMFVSISLFYWLIPLGNHSRGTYFEKLFGIGLANYKNGFLAKRFQVWLRPVIYYLIPFLGCLFWNAYSVLLCSATPLLINLLLLLFHKENRDLTDLILSLQRVSLADSLLYQNEKEMNEASKKLEEEAEEDDYLNALESVDLLEEEKEKKKP